MTAPSTAARRRLLFCACVVLVAALRLCWLDADPSPSMPDATVMDEGLWADSARGHVLFPGDGDYSDWFADGLGNSRLIAPLYSWLLVGVYSLFGIGLWQTRLLAAVASIATAALVGRFVAARSNTNCGSLAVLVLGLCPLLDQHGRFALLESTQGFFLLLSFVLLFPVRRSAIQAALAGAAMGASILVKPNSVTFGVAPFAVAFAASWRHEARNDPSAHRRRLGDGLCVVGGGLAVLAAFGLPVWLPHWSEFVATARYESGWASWSLGDHLLRLGLIGSREKYEGAHQLWGLLRHAPLCCAGVWLLLLRAAAGRRWQCCPGERELWCWLGTAMALAESSFDHVARRQVLFTVPMACLTVQCWRNRSAPVLEGKQWPQYVAWLLLLLPAGLLGKPVLANALGAALSGSRVVADEGAAGLVAGWVLVAAVGLLPLLPIALGAVAQPCLLRAGRWGGLGTFLYRHVCDAQPWLLRAGRCGPVLLVLLAASEALRLSALPPHRYSIRRAQEQFAPLVEPGETVLGDHAATLFQSVRVHTVRRVIAGRQRSSPRPNPDVAARLHPRYVVDYADPELREFADVTGSGFRTIGRVGFLQEAAGGFRFDVELWERQ